MTIATKPVGTALPFDAAKLDKLMDDAGLDALVVTSKHNVQYLLGGYRSFFFDIMDAIGVSRYLPVMIYPKGRPGDAAFLGNPLEVFDKELGAFWTPRTDVTFWGDVEPMKAAAAHLEAIGGVRRVGVEPSFIPASSDRALRAAMPGAEIGDAQFVLERLRAVKSPAELELLREASERVVASMLATFSACAPGMTKREVVDRLRREEFDRGLTFEYCLMTAGTGFNRAASDQKLVAGDPMTLDSGANFHGYIGDVCRMGILGEPDSELRDLLAEIEMIQQEARKPVKAGARGGDIYAIAEPLVAASPNRERLDFLAHGMGLVSHEAPRLTGKGFVPYPGYDADRPLEAGMVISIETTLKHPRGYIKLEDTLAVTETGWVGFGDSGRGWNRAGR